MHIFHIPSETKVVKSQRTSMIISLASEIQVRVKVSPWHFILQHWMPIVIPENQKSSSLKELFGLLCVNVLATLILSVILLSLGCNLLKQREKSFSFNEWNYENDKKLEQNPNIENWGQPESSNLILYKKISLCSMNNGFFPNASWLNCEESCVKDL